MDHVAHADRCPACGEDRIDYLLIHGDGYDVACLTCDRTYRISHVSAHGISLTGLPDALLSAVQGDTAPAPETATEVFEAWVLPLLAIDVAE